ncbi:unnamed protein product [Schistosoma margrebowiei]|uniref:Uncharacterized protein n=1 Tax=Schistosoma margrebowiei TaxID=48269 RepID=A0A183LFK2_9TREM|nr:unnamed protein product [Schistosoma margrebowiei]
MSKAISSINDDTLKLSTMSTTTVLDSLSKLRSQSSKTLNSTVVPKNSVGDWTHVKRAKKGQASQSKLNIQAVERKSTGDLVAQSTHKIVRPVIKEPRIHKSASTPKQQGAKQELSEKPGTTITVRDDYLIVMNFKDNPDLPLSLQDKNDTMLWGELNKNLGLPRIEPLTVTRLTRGMDSKHQNLRSLLRVTLKNATDVEDVLLASHLLKSDGNVRILPDIQYSERNLIRNIPKETRDQFLHGRNIIVQGIPENTDPTQSNSDIKEWKFIKQSSRLTNILTQYVTRIAMKDGDPKPRLMKTTFPSSHMAAATLEAFRAKRRRLPPGIHMHPDWPYEEVNFLTTDLAKDFLNAFGNLLDSLMLPQLQAIPNKVFVEKTVPIDVQKLDLVEYTKKFVKILKETSEFLENRFLNINDIKVYLHELGTIDFTNKTLDRLPEVDFHFKSFQNKSIEKIQSTLDTKRISSVVNPDMLKELEIYAETWINQLEQVMVIADQIRKEADNTGPRVELEYWRRRMITFNTIFEEMNKHNCKIVFGILSTFNCPLVKVRYYRWLKLESQVMDYTNEAKNNLKFLSTLEEYCEPLYRCDPIGMLDSIPKLVTMIRLVYEISTFYNTQEKITSLFVKVTNQMIFACKAYITNNYQSTIWTEKTEIILKKIIDCCNLHQVYKNSFQRIKTELAAKPNSKQFDLSEIHIFGKYDLFCQRLGEINDIFQMISSYSCLLVSKIEKLDPLIEMYNFSVNKLRNSEFDFLDQRKTEVDDCIMDFKKKMSDIRTSLRSLLDTEMNRHHDLQRSLHIIGQFEKLNLPNLGVDEAHLKSLHRFSQLIDHVGKEYSKFKASPPIGRDIPPIAGKISWAKELYRRIESPMLMLTDKIKLMRSKEGKEITKKYNKLAEVLITYEMVHYRNWINQISFAKVGLRDPLLYQAEGTNRIIVALDPEILVVYREIELLSKWGLDIPEIAVELSQKETQLKLHYNKLKSMLTSINEIEVNLDPMFIKLMRAQFAHLQNLLKPGLSLLNWTSLGINHFIDDVTSYINQLKLLSERAHDLEKYRIEQILNEISNITLCELSDSEPWTIDYFLEHTNYLCSKAGDILQIKSQVIQDSVHELIDMLCGAYRLQLMQEEEKDERNVTCIKGSGKSTLSSQKSIYPESAVSRTTGTKSARECRKRLVEDAALRVLEHFHQRTVDTLTKLIRNTLDNLRKCLTLPAILAYDSVNSDGSVQLYFSCHAQLSIPSIVLHPSLDDFQKALNTATHLIISVTRHISVWDLRLRNPYGLKGHSEIEESFSSIEEVKKSSQTDSSTHSGNELTREITVSSGTNELVTYTTDERFSVADDEYENKGDENYFNKISQNKEINKLRGMLTNAFSSIQQSAKSSLRHFDQYKSLWEKSKTEEFDKFMSNNPSVIDFEEIIQQFYEKDQLISNEPDVCDCSPLAIYTNQLKDGLLAETRNWRLEYGRLCSSKFKTQVESLFATIEKYEKILSRPINDLDDIRILMNALKDLREMEANVDLQLGPIEESYSLLAKHSIPVDKEETDKADTLRYEWDKLCKQMLEVQNQLVDVQPEFRNNLLENITTFNENCSTFYDDYDKVSR